MDGGRQEPHHPQAEVVNGAARTVPTVTIMASLVDDRRSCELISVSAAILERNVSSDVAQRYKLLSLRNIVEFAVLVRTSATELSGCRWNSFGG